MVGCPRCGGSSAVQISRDGEHPWTRDEDRSGPRWMAHCDSCGSDWTLVD